MDPVRFWNLSKMAKSPAHYNASLQAGDDPTPAMERGTGVHSLVLGGAKVVAYPGAVRRGKEWESFRAEHEGATIILTAAEYDKTHRMADAVASHADAMRILTGVREQTIMWEFLGRACRATPDVRNDAWIAELKTSQTSDPRRFAGHAIRMAYHAQLAWYRQAVLSSALGKPREAYVVAVESSAPYPVTVLRLTDRALEQGERLFRLWFEQLLVCESFDTWNGYVQSIVDLDVPDDLELSFGELEAA